MANDPVLTGQYFIVFFTVIDRIEAGQAICFPGKTLVK